MYWCGDIYCECEEKKKPDEECFKCQLFMKNCNFCKYWWGEKSTSSLFNKKCEICESGSEFKPIKIRRR